MPILGRIWPRRDEDYDTEAQDTPQFENVCLSLKSLILLVVSMYQPYPCLIRNWHINIIYSKTIYTSRFMIE